jgi:hypothetical protein
VLAPVNDGLSAGFVVPVAAGEVTPNVGLSPPGGSPSTTVAGGRVIVVQPDHGTTSVKEQLTVVDWAGPPWISPTPGILQ